MILGLSPQKKEAKTEEAFWPTKTRTALTSLENWFREVSRDMEDLPVWRSPIISSRWPIPTGTTESMQSMPEKRGSKMLVLETMPGDGASKSQVWARFGGQKVKEKADEGSKIDPWINGPR
jgi:hypothetical protein